MNYRQNMTICITVLLLGSSQASLGANEINEIVHIAALDSPDGPPPCGEDGVCNLAACSQDPDCPKNLPGNTNQPSSTGSYNRPGDIKDCTSQETGEIDLAIGWGATNWDEFDAVLEDIRDWPVTIGNCLKKRFKENGKVVCEKSNKGLCKRAEGWASYLNKKCHMCPDFLTRVRAISGVENRQACYFAMVAHEWGHTCERGHKTLAIIDDEAFNFWKSKHPNVTIELGHCGLK